MSAISVTISGDSPDELAVRLCAMADALAAPTRPPVDKFPISAHSGGLPPVPSSPPPRACSVHHVALTLDSWTSKAGKACKAWRCPSSTAASGCDIEWAS